MPSLTLKNIPDEIMDRLRSVAERERRSMNQQAIRILDDGLKEERPLFFDRYKEFIRRYGPSPLRDEDFEGLRLQDEGRPAPFQDVDEWDWDDVDE